jgi:signal transduction histidine kinase
MDPGAAPRGRLFRKYLVAFVLLVGGAVVASGTIEALFSYVDNKRAIIQIEQGRATSAADAIERRVTEISNALESTVRPGQASGRAGLERRRDDFLRLLREVPAIEELQYIDAAGREQVHTSRRALDLIAPGPDRSKDPAYESTRAATLDNHHGLYLGRVTFLNGIEPHMAIAVGEPKPLSGAMVADVNLDFVGEALLKFKVGRSGEAYAIDSGGELILHSDSTLVLRRTSVKNLPQVRSALNHGRVGLAGTDAAGKKVLSASEAIAPTGWHVFVEEPLSEAFAPLRRAIYRTIVLLAAALALAVLFSLFFARRMTTPIRRLQEGAARIGAGDLEQSIDVDTGDELQALAAEFNQMTSRLRESYAGLEQKVAERTHDLGVALQQLEEKGRELETVSRHKSDFLAGMSHELRTPLNAIIGFSEVLNEKMFGELNERQVEYVNDILGAGRHLLSLINDILDLSKVEAGKMELDLGPVLMADTLASGVALHRERASRKGIDLSLDVPTIDEISADERKVRQVLFNLLSNALKFTPEGGRITVSARADDGIVAVSVADTGPGIRAEDVEHIFEEFRQVAGTQEGTGLGLALSRRFVELHGGRLWVDSEFGSGSTFTFTLPATPVVAAT